MREDNWSQVALKYYTDDFSKINWEMKFYKHYCHSSKPQIYGRISEVTSIQIIDNSIRLFLSPLQFNSKIDMSAVVVSKVVKSLLCYIREFLFDFHLLLFFFSIRQTRLPKSTLIHHTVSKNKTTNKPSYTS